MEHAAQTPNPPARESSAAFALWLRRMLKSSLDDTVHEPIPLELIELLPPPTKR